MAYRARTELRDPDARNWLDHHLGKYYITIRTVWAFLAFALGLLLMAGALMLAYLYLGNVPLRAALMTIGAAVIAAFGLRSAVIAVRHTAGARWPGILAIVLDSALIIGVIGMYVLGFVL